MNDGRHATLHVFALASFAVAQPLYDLIGRNAEFLVAHRAGAGTIAALILVLSFVIPLVLVAVIGAARRIDGELGRAAHLLVVGSLAGLTVAGMVRELPPPPAIGSIAVAGIVAAWAYQAPIVRAFLTISSAAIVIFPLVFVAATPVSHLVRPARTLAGAAPTVRQPPIVLVVFDELDTLTLLDATGRIDEKRFPNFAALVRTTTWFPNAVASFPYTPYAIPAIATGRRPDAALRKLPTAADHPGNLFTWLGGTYRMHVAEPITSLCPPALCGSTAADPASRARDLASDIGIIYLHLVVPRGIAATRLPTLAFAWRGFAAPSSGPRASGASSPRADAAFERAASMPRDEVFRQWVREIAPASAPTLHFVHSLLPHEPYSYLPSGVRYADAELTGGLAPDWSWTSSQAVVETGRLRHAAQVRFADALLGELIARLRSSGLYDPALIVVTSDHGAAFRAGDSHRGLTTTNYRQILAAPMFVKAPGQREGGVNERTVSGIDVLPTIADVLGGQLPWQTDGHSVLAPDFPSRPLLEYAGLSLPPLPAFDVRAEARNAPDRGTRDSALVGRALADLEILPAASGVQVLSNDLRAFEAVAPKRFVPGLVEGRIDYDEPPRTPVDVAVAVNGVVRAVTQTASWGGSPHFFTAFLGEYDVRAGANDVAVLAIDPSAPRHRLRLLSTDLAAGLMLKRDAAGEFLEMKTGRRLALTDEVSGFVDRIDVEPDGCSFHGWGVDRGAARQLRAIAVVAGVSSIAFGFPADVRPDVAAALSLPAGTKASYAVRLDPDDLRRGAVRVFGIAADRAGELQWSPQARQFVARLNNPANR